jgi:Zn-dependent protease
MKQSLRLGTISGIPVGLNWGLLLIAGLYLSSLATGFLPSAAPGFSTVSYWLVAAGGVGLFFASILAHELGHSLVAQSEGIRVRAITLWLLGGVAELEKEADNPGAEFRIAAAGPAVSLMLGLLFGGSALAYSAVFGSSLIVTMLAWLGIVNAILAAFNLIPASPLDGGRILTAVLWHRSGNPNSARARSAKVGQVFGTLLLGFGAYTFFGGGGFWLLIIGWFLLSGATAERRRAELFEAATHASVGEVMTPLASPTDSAVTIAGLLAMSGPTPRAAFPVRGPDGVIAGIVPTGALAGISPGQHGQIRALDLMIGWDEFVSARTSEPLSHAVERMRATNAVHVLVYDDAGRQAGYVGLAQLTGAASRVPA